LVAFIGILLFLVKDSVVKNRLFVQTGRDCGCDAKTNQMNSRTLHVGRLAVSLPAGNCLFRSPPRIHRAIWSWISYKPPFSGCV
jgi:hypothetical protein